MITYPLLVNYKRLRKKLILKTVILTIFYIVLISTGKNIVMEYGKYNSGVGIGSFLLISLAALYICSVVQQVASWYFKVEKIIIKDSFVLLFTLITFSAIYFPFLGLGIILYGIYFLSYKWVSKLTSHQYDVDFRVKYRRLRVLDIIIVIYWFLILAFFWFDSIILAIFLLPTFCYTLARLGGYQYVYDSFFQIEEKKRMIMHQVLLNYEKKYGTIDTKQEAPHFFESIKYDARDELVKELQ